MPRMQKRGFLTLSHPAFAYRSTIEQLDESTFDSQCGNQRVCFESLILLE